MKFNSIREITLFEHRFWLQILGDHSRFILNALSPKEIPFIREVSQFIILFDSLLERCHKPISDEELYKLNHEAYSASMKIRKFKLSIITKQLEEKIDISLPPTFINHMVNELEEYIYVLNALIVGKMPFAKEIHLHLLWLPDGVGHASTIVNNLDMTQKELIMIGKEYSRIFTDFYLKAIEYNGYTRTGICEFPALKKFNEDVDEVMTRFKKFIKELENGVLENKILGTLSTLILDHMLREECYYLTKLSMVSGTKSPGCDPAKSRFEI